MALIFDNFFDSTVTSNANSAAFQAAVNAVENFLTSQLTTFGANSDVTLRINWRFATTDYNGKPFLATTLANNVFLNNGTASYTDIRNALLARVDSNDANPGDDTAFTGALPVTDPGIATTGNTVRWILSRGQEKLLGLGGVAADAGNAQTDPDTGATLNSAFAFDFDRSDGITAGQTDAFGVIAHELTEVVMGRFMFGGAVFNDSSGKPTPFNNYSLMDLLHFTSAANGSPGRAIVETGTNNIISFTGTQGDPNFNLVLDNNGDIADPNNIASPRNSFADSVSGVINAITQTDLRIMDAIGWTRVHGLDDHNQSNTAATAVLNVNNGINGSIELQGDHDWFKVVLDPTKHYAVSVEGSAMGGGTLADPFVALYGGANPSRDTTAPQLTADNGGVGANSLLLTGFGLSGNFFVDVGSIGTAPESVVGKVQDIGTGTYRVTLFGNAPPVLSADAGSPHAKTELPGTTDSSTPDQVSGTLSFTDADVGDTHTASASLDSEIWSGGATIPLATQVALAGAMSDSISLDGTTGSLDWQFSLADRNVDFLAVGETLTAVYDVTVTDHHAGSPLSDSSTQQVTVVFTGANDLPMVDAGSSVLANSTSERPNLTNSSLIDSTPLGIVAFTDPDLNDRPTATLNTAGETVTWQDATHDFTSELTPAQIAILEAGVSISAEAGNTNTGKIDWHYDIVDKNLDFLGVGESLTVTAPILIDDHNGGVISQNVVATINGANDNPIAAADSNGTSKNSTISVSAVNGLLANDTDPDAHDQGHLFVGAVGGLATNVGHSVAGTYGSVGINTDGSYVYVANKGSLPSKIVAQDTFTYTVADGHGGTNTSTLSVIVTNPNVDYLAGANTTLNGGNGKQVLDGSAGHDVLIGGNSPDVLVGGIGDTMTGGNGPDTFLFRPNFGANTITDFDFHNDAIQLDKSIFSSVADLLSHTTNTANGAVIDDTHGDTITLTNVTLEQLQTHQNDFYLV
jgi:VCBS repeat-containing protein